MKHHAPRSERIVGRIPFALLEHPFACLMAVWGVVSGPPILAGYARPSSLVLLLPRPFVVAWTMLFVLASLSIAWGLLRRRYSTTMARGLQLLAVVCLVYAVAILSVAGWRDGIPGGPLLTVIAVLCWTRGWYLRTQAAILHRAKRTGASVEQEMTAREMS